MHKNETGARVLGSGMPRRLSTQDKELAERARGNLERFREQLGWSAAALAERAGIPLDTYRQLEKGLRRLTNASVLRDLARATGQRMEDFYAEDPPNPDLARIPCFSLQVLPGEEVDSDILRDLQRAVADAEDKHRKRRGTIKK